MSNNFCKALTLLLFAVCLPTKALAQDSCYWTILGCAYEISEAPQLRGANILQPQPTYSAAPGETLVRGILLDPQPWRNLVVTTAFTQGRRAFRAGHQLRVHGAIWVKDEVFLFALPSGGARFTEARSTTDCLLVDPRTLRPAPRACMYWQKPTVDGRNLPGGYVSLHRGNHTYEPTGPLIERYESDGPAASTPFLLSYEGDRHGNCLVSLRIGNRLSETLVSQGPMDLSGLLRIDQVQCTPEQLSLSAQVLPQ